MEPIVAVMLILGCDHSMMVCRRIAAPVPQYASVGECEADANMQVRFVDDYPMAVAKCIEVPGLVRGERVVIDWRLDAVGRLAAEAAIDRGEAVIVADAGGR